MLYYYPFWPNKPNAQGLRTQIQAYTRCFDEEKFKDHYFVAQAHAYYDTLGNTTVRRPKPTELNATSMLALAHGAKGLIFWHYLRYRDGEGRLRNFGLLDSNDIKTDLWYYIKEKIEPRLHGKLGNTLMKLKYGGENAIKIKNIYDQSDSTYPQTSFLGMDCATNDSVFAFAGLLEDENVSDVKYAMLVNLICADSNLTKNVIVNLQRPSSEFQNFGFYSVEGDPNFCYSFCNSTGSKTFTFQAGQGVLFKLAPVLKYGGEIVGDDTVSSSLTLLDSMKIEDGATLTLKSTYSTNANIFIENGGWINVAQGGILKPSLNNLVNIQSWNDKLLKARTTGTPHPRLFWGSHSSASFYQVHKKYGGSAWQIIDTTSSTEYIDSTLTLAQQTSGALVKYMVSAVIFQRRDPDFDSTDVVEYTSAEGEIEKRVVEGEEENLLPKEYSLSGNYPNPFNPSTTIKYALPEISDVKIEIFDITGRLVKDFVFDSQSAGYKEIVWHGDNNSGMKVSSGIYILSFKAAAVKGNRSFMKSRKLVLVK